jgi:hypothetical protein
MSHGIMIGLAAALLAAGIPLDAQTRPQAPRRTATLPERPPAPPRDGHHAPRLHHDGRDGGHGHAHQRVIPSCDGLAALAWPWDGSLGPAPQMGTNQPVPNANGLPPAPGLSPVPGMSPVPGLSPVPGAAPTPGSSVPASPATGSGMSTLEPLHSGWRTAGTTYIESVCYVRDAYGQLHLIYF